MTSTTCTVGGGGSGGLAFRQALIRSRQPRRDRRPQFFIATPRADHAGATMKPDWGGLCKAHAPYPAGCCTGFSRDEAVRHREQILAALAKRHPAARPVRPTSIRLAQGD